MSSFIFPPIRNHHKTIPWTLNEEEMGNATAQFDLHTLTEEQIKKRRELIRNCMEQEKDEVKEGKPSSCMAGRGAFWISWDGKMYPCGMLPNFSQDIRAMDFHSAWEETCESMKQVNLPKECSECKYQKICPSCAAIFFSVNGKSNQIAEELCARTKAYVTAFLGDT